MTSTLKQTNEEKALCYLILNPEGFSEREGVFNLNFTSGRNYINTAEKLLGIKFNRQWEKTENGEGQYYRYQLPDRHTAEKVIKYLNAKSALRGETAITAEQVQHILSRFDV
ncbi:hypothetical protein PTQ27_01310 [Mannheimia sp. AT1]|uniref:Uncharacterized protein n=1 Tax=Mannheimia cairinae TaxID=3025936 RepID=A0ABT5MM73_9PAST|nr:hypothetical protein [Mannheimia cairinae]MDD0823112.1 hypothetical protein [Mannheimia cairinae]MDD0825863.1 hypothetical protein [Mannheimia cairinae]